jgi:hypothetical protein
VLRYPLQFEIADDDQDDAETFKQKKDWAVGRPSYPIKKLLADEDMVRSIKMMTNSAHSRLLSRPKVSARSKEMLKTRLIGRSVNLIHPAGNC